jgi:hypothetical protein
VALVVRGRKPRRKAVSTPSAVLESRLTDQLARVMRTAQRSLQESDILSAIDNLDPSAMERIYDQGNVYSIDGYLERALEAAFLTPSVQTFADVIRTPMGRGVARPVQAGVRLENGIFVPSDLVRKAADPANNLVMQALLQYINPKATEYARRRAAELVREISDSNRLALRRTLVDGYSSGASRDELAGVIRQSVGLHTRWARAVSSYRQRTYSQLTRQGWTPSSAATRTDMMGDRYRSRLIRKRAEMIARTEVMTAQNMGRVAAWDAGVKEGLIDPSAQKMWQVSPPGISGGEGPCEFCLEVNGTQVGIYESFDVGQWRGRQALMAPPAHPHCRCTVQLVPPSRGLTGLPSQDMGPWLDDLDAFYAEMESAA